MDEMKRREFGASEVIGAVLLVSLVVIGGAIAAAFVFGQPTPKEVPHVSFSASVGQDRYNVSEYDLTLYHTGGDTLQWDNFSVIVDGDDLTDQINESQREKSWSFEAPLTIEDVRPDISSVVLTYHDGSGGDTVLRKVGVAYQAPESTVAPPGPWTISGYKWNVTATGQLIGPLNNTVIRLTKTLGNVDFPVDGMVATTDGNGYFSFSVPEHEATYSLAEEVNLTVWKPHSPSTGRYDSIPLSHHQTSAVKNFSNERLPPPPMKISGHKFNVTWKGVMIGPLSGIVINLTKTSGDAPGFPAQGKTATTNDTGYYEFEVPGWWDFEVPAVLPTYRLTEEADRAEWNPYNPASGVIENVLPGATGQDFSNWKVVPNKKISGYKWGYYNTTGWLIGPVPNIKIDLTLTSGDIPDMQVGQTNTTRTNANGYYEFVVSGFPASYTLRETMNLSEWKPWIPSTGSFENVPPGATRDFGNMRIVPPPLGGSVMRLEKEEETGTNTSGYLVGGTFFQVDTKGGDHVTFGTTMYTFKNNEQVRLVLNGDQDRGRMTVTKGGTNLIEFSFNVTLQKMDNHGNWVDVPGASGLITDISITNINKNGGNEYSTLTFQQPPYNSTTMLRLDGKPRITSPPDDATPLKFDNLHIVHDNSESEGNNVMWIWLEPGNNSLLVEGDYVFL